MSSESILKGVAKMTLTQKEKTTITDLQTQEKSCVQKYQKYESEAKDPVLKDLFHHIAEKEQQHYDTLGAVLSGTVPECNCDDSEGCKYDPEATYKGKRASADMTSDCFLVTDCIGSEKLISSEYNFNVFNFGDSSVRKLLACIQVEEQNHAEMLYKYKTVNGMK